MLNVSLTALPVIVSIFHTVIPSITKLTKKLNFSLSTPRRHTYRGLRYTAPLILNLGTRWKWPISRPSHFTSGRDLNSRLGESQSLSSEKSPAPAGIRTADHPVRKLVTIQTTLSRQFAKCQQLILCHATSLQEKIYIRYM